MPLGLKFKLSSTHVQLTGTRLSPKLSNILSTPIDKWGLKMMS